MVKKCEITGKSSSKAGKYSNRTRATQFNPSGNRRQKANIQRKRIFVPETGKTYRINLTAQAIKTIAKNGAYKVLKQAKIIR